MKKKSLLIGIGFVAGFITCMLFILFPFSVGMQKHTHRMTQEEQKLYKIINSNIQKLDADIEVVFGSQKNGERDNFKITIFESESKSMLCKLNKDSAINIIFSLVQPTLIKENYHSLKIQLISGYCNQWQGDMVETVFLLNNSSVIK